MHDLEMLKKKQEETYAEAVEANRISAALPRTPKIIHFADKAVPHATYEAATLKEAIEIFRLFTPLPWVIAENGSFTRLNILSEIERDNARGKGNAYTIRSEIDGAPYFDCQQGVGFSSNEMEFFADAAGKTLKISVRIEHSPIRVDLARRSQTRPSEGYIKTYPKPSHAELIKWGYGEDCCKGTYWFQDLETFWLSMEDYAVTKD